MISIEFINKSVQILYREQHRYFSLVIEDFSILEYLLEKAQDQAIIDLLRDARIQWLSALENDFLASQNGLIFPDCLL